MGGQELIVFEWTAQRDFLDEAGEAARLVIVRVYQGRSVRHPYEELVALGLMLEVLEERGHRELVADALDPA